jgi:hypothetical protein
MQPADGVDVTVPAAGPWTGGSIPGRAPGRRLLAVAGSVALPATAAVAVLRFLIPSRLEGAAGGIAGFWAWLGYH